MEENAPCKEFQVQISLSKTLPACVLKVVYFDNNDVYIVCYYFSLTAYTGDTCSEDKNGCAEIECFKGVECLDVPAPGVGAMCGSCDTGFTGDGLKCTGNESINIEVEPMNQSALFLYVVTLIFLKKILMSALQILHCVTRSV